MKRSLIALALLPVIATTAFAEEYREHAAHVHGEVELNLVVDADQLLIEVTAPGADVVGFEHAPQNNAQTAAIEKAIATLTAGDQLFQFDTRCILADAHVTETLTGDSHDDHAHHDDHYSHDHDDHAHHDGHDSHDHDDHAHHDKHDSHDHDDHAHHDDHDSHDHDDHAHHDDHDGHDHEDEHGGHGEFSAEYTFDCDDIADLSEMQLGWFDAFPSTEKVKVQAITDTAQKAGSLTADQAQFNF
uniref:zinc uptake protein ZrgA n=1 Tax=Thaumasiovibrio occultus TaxID=1891184 RepID=UPI000B34B2DC|nr:DUF2796 domain-containing protein [Thaumasiovibrio occultus]